MRRCVVRSTLAERRRKAQRSRLKLLVPVRCLAWGEVLRRRAEFRQSVYWIAYLTRLLGVRCGLGDHGIVELAGTVMHDVSFNTIAHGMRLGAPFSDMEAADVAPRGRYEHLLPGGRPSSGAQRRSPNERLVREPKRARRRQSRRNSQSGVSAIAQELRTR